MIACVFCQSTSARFWHAHQGSDGVSYNVQRCAICGSSFVHPYPSAEYLDAFYRGPANPIGGYLDSADVRRNLEEMLEREKQFPNASLDAKRLAGQARKYATGRRFLDIGAGYGQFTRAALDEGFNCTAIEPSPNAVAMFQLLNGFSPQAQNFDEAFVAAHEGAFDVVLMSQVLEHIPNPAHAVRNLHRLLTPGGICVIAVPHFGSLVSRIQGTRDMFIVPPEHVNFFSRRGLLSIFSNNGFDCLTSYTVSRFDHRRMKARLRVPVVSGLACAVLDVALKASDTVGMGTILNALFRKVP